MTEQRIDNGNETIVADTEAADNRAVSNGKAAEIVKAVSGFENKLAVTAKEWGVAIANATFVDGVSLDTLIGENKLAAGFASLSNGGEAGRKAKGRLNVYFSNIRKVAENWANLEKAEQDNILNGTTSIHYLADTIRKAERDAAKAEAKALAEAETEAAETPVTLNDMAVAFLAAYNAASMDERNAAFDTIADIMAAVDADTEAQGMAETETVAEAA